MSINLFDSSHAPSSWCSPGSILAESKCDCCVCCCCANPASWVVEILDVRALILNGKPWFVLLLAGITTIFWEFEDPA